MLYAATLLPGDKDQKPSPLPFLGASLAIGAFALLPYLAIRKYRPEAIDPNFLKVSGVYERKATGCFVARLGLTEIDSHRPRKQSWNQGGLR